MKTQLEKIEKLCKDLLGLDSYAGEDGEREETFPAIVSLPSSDSLYQDFMSYLQLMAGDKTSAGQEDAILSQRIIDEVEEWREFNPPAQPIPRQESRELTPTQAKLEEQAKKEQEREKAAARVEAVKQAITKLEQLEWEKALDSFDCGDAVHLVYPDTGETYLIEDFSSRAVYFRESQKDRSQVKLRLGEELRKSGKGFIYSLTGESCYLAKAQ